ncbi:putative toxin-antitoxin system toxin component, PIN family [Caenimonas koreensis DSM 17982]|uniref:Putative toxin-antitoxin system toxin component, PIN family n=1 Tax=Caenimonas koreensis DSM 17982 TaxID=1121255 RepID=A0A844AXX3_9BURK|nr:putative toxin-antitoxin system toxin component, PIN family [Caenimonas koreensis]MRD49215.1 putative toxin-antitoxin system toxin component, PIN family [Caenimonas koreensis DSM 17982]
MTSRPLVIDTNVVLDIFLFDDAAAKPLKALLETGTVRWLATQVMRDELERVLDYSQLQPRLAYYALTPADILAGFDRYVQIVEPAQKAPVTCTDGDDQKFIDLAVAHKCLLLSKDAAVLKTRKRLERLDVQVMKALPAAAASAA